MIKKFLCGLTAMLIAGASVFAMSAPEGKSYYSPNKKIGVTINGGEHIQYSITLNGETILAPSPISLKLTKDTWSKGAIKSIKSKSVASETIVAPLYRQKSYETGGYTEVTVSTYAGYNIIFRIYDEGVAYCYSLNKKGEVIIYDELADFTLPTDNTVYLSHSTNPRKQVAMAFQNNYQVTPISEANDKILAFFPIAVDCGNGAKMVITEAELESYPGMFVMAQPANKSLKAQFANYPKSMAKYDWRQQSYVTETEEYIAKVQGKRNLPWRVIAISENDTQLPVNNLVYSLSSPNRIGDVSWIKGGKVAWDWWNDWGVYGVDFEVGINTQTYKYYIDFASENGIEYIVLDEGWYNPKSGDMLTIIPEIDLEELVAYGKSKNVEIILWTVFNVLDEQLEAACQKYSDMGIVGFKIDFLDRDDQTATEMAYRIAETCAKYHLTVDYHGYYKPTGMSRTYPNIVNYEAVFGMEEAKWQPIKDMPENDVTIPFIRILCGAVDFTQGGMNNASKENFRPIYNDPMTQGTRCHQLATYIVYDSPLVMLADSPTAYKNEQECVDFIVSIPTVVDKTIIPQGKMAEYVVTARQAGDNWYVGGMTDWNSRDITVDFSFLGEGDYEATIFTDGKNADKYAYDYKSEKKIINKSTKLDIHMAQGGGFAITLIKK
ncbi:MAG: glycoside hydrolase family 97 protein [Odoribacter sp.]|nr:glycoside hydrolase family 97 protein [Odoribacter sp.]